MQNLITNENNLSRLKKEFSQAQEEILICSAWITSGMLRRVLTAELVKRIRAGKITLRVLIRLGEKSDVRITDPGVFDMIEELGPNASLRYHRKLHAKSFVVDNRWAMVGSFNLTGGGFGDEDRPGANPETGFEFIDPAAVKEVRERFEELWNRDDVQELSSTLLGFVLSPSDSHEFSMLGIRDLAMNQFVQVKIDQGEYLIGKIVETQKHDFSYYDTQLGEGNSFKQFEITDAFGKSTLGGLAKAMAFSPSGNTQVKVARVRVVNKVKMHQGRLLPGEGLSLPVIPADVASEVHNADKQMLEQVFSYKGFAPAVLFANRDIDVGLDPEELTTKHFSVFGSTGSGKSYFVKQLLANNLYPWFCKRNRGRIIIFDPHDEYREGRDMPEEFATDGKKFVTIDAGKYKARLIRDIDDLEESLGLKFSRREEKRVVENILLQAVRRKMTNQQFMEMLKKEALMEARGPQVNLEEGLRGLETALDPAFYQYLSELRDMAAKIVDQELDEGTITSDDLKTRYNLKEKGDAKSRYVHEKLVGMYNALPADIRSTLKEQVINKHVHKKIEGYFESDIRVIPEEVIDIIETTLDQHEITIEQLDLVQKMEKPKVYRVNLSRLHEEDSRHKLTASILTQIFNEKKEGQAKMDTVFVIEEAHNFAPEGGGRNNPAARIIQKIAAEGRKFRLGLIVITQRPAYVSKGVLSQCSTQAIFRLINQNDLNQIREVVEGVSEAELNQLPRFETGQAIFSGVAIRQPVIVKGKRL